MAYWLIHHLHDPRHWARLEYVLAPGDVPTAATASMAVGDTARVITLRLRNDNPWLDLCPLIRAKVDTAPAAAVRCTLDGEDVSTAMLGREGLACVGNRRMWPHGARELRMTIPVNDAPVNVTVELSAHPTADPNQVRQRLVFRLLPTDPVMLSSEGGLSAKPHA